MDINIEHYRSLPVIIYQMTFKMTVAKVARAARATCQSCQIYQMPFTMTVAKVARAALWGQLINKLFTCLAQ